MRTTRTTEFVVRRESRFMQKLKLGSILTKYQWIFLLQLFSCTNSKVMKGRHQDECMWPTHHGVCRLSVYLWFFPVRLLYQDTRPWELTLQQKFRVCFFFSCIAISLPFGCRLVFECGDSFLLSVGHESKDADMRYVNSRVQGAFLVM